MKYQKVTINGKTIFIPDYYHKVDSMPDDPEGSVPYMVQTHNHKPNNNQYDMGNCRSNRLT